MHSVGWKVSETIGWLGGWVGYLYFYEFWVLYRIRQDVNDEGPDSCMGLLQFRHRLGVFWGPYTDSIFDLVCYVFGKLFVEFWVVKLPETLSFEFLSVHHYGGLTFIMTLSFRSVKFLRASRSCLVKLSAIFKGLAFSISLVIRCMKRSSAGSLFLSGVHVLLRLNG